MDEAYIVCGQRSDGSFPKVCKAIGDRLFYMQSDAADFIDGLVEDGFDRSRLGIYVIHVKIVEQAKPIKAL